MASSETVGSITELATMEIPSAGTESSVLVLGYHEPGDQGGGQFFWDATCRLADDGGLMIRPVASPDETEGRWRRIFEGPVSVKWFGARGDGATADTLSIQRVLDMLGTRFNEVYFPSGRYVIDRQLNLVSRTGCLLTFSPGAALEWHGSVRSQSVMALFNCVDMTIKNMSITVAQAGEFDVRHFAEAAVLICNQGKKQYFERLNVDGDVYPYNGAVKQPPFRRGVLIRPLLEVEIVADDQVIARRIGPARVWQHDIERMESFAKFLNEHTYAEIFLPEEFKGRETIRLTDLYANDEDFRVLIRQFFGTMSGKRMEWLLDPFVMKPIHNERDNDHHSFIKCTFRFIDNACVEIRGAQSRVHSFIDNFMTDSRFGVRASEGSFSWRGGAMANMHECCFFLGSISPDPILISAACIEGCSRLLLATDDPDHDFEGGLGSVEGESRSRIRFPFDHERCYRQAQPVVIESVMFALDTLPVDGHETIDGTKGDYARPTIWCEDTDISVGEGMVPFSCPIYMRWGGPLVMIGNKFSNGNNSSGIKRIKFHIGPASAPAAIISLGNVILNDNPFKVSPYYLSSNTESDPFEAPMYYSSETHRSLPINRSLLAFCNISLANDTTTEIKNQYPDSCDLQLCLDQRISGVRCESTRRTDYSP